MKKTVVLLSLIASASLVGCKTLPTQQITTNQDGSQAGVCHFKNGSQCDGWEYLRGECKPAADKPILY